MTDNPLAFAPRYIAFADLIDDLFPVAISARNPDARLREDLGLDSLALLELWLALEEVAGRELDPELLSALVTVADAYYAFEQLQTPSG